MFIMRKCLLKNLNWPKNEIGLSINLDSIFVKLHSYMYRFQWDNIFVRKVFTIRYMNLTEFHATDRFLNFKFGRSTCIGNSSRKNMGG